VAGMNVILTYSIIGPGENLRGNNGDNGYLSIGYSDSYGNSIANTSLQYYLH